MCLYSGLTAVFMDVAKTQPGCKQNVTRTWEVTDGCYNVVAMEQSIVVVDKTPPDFAVFFTMADDASEATFLATAPPVTLDLACDAAAHPRVPVNGTP